MASDLAQNRRALDWWPVFVREMFAAIGVALDGKPLDPTLDYDIKGPWPDHRIEIAYVSREESFSWRKPCETARRHQTETRPHRPASCPTQALVFTGCPRSRA